MTSPGFQGNLVAADADVPAHLGLHHHGDEPGRAGYSLEELFQLSRSSNLQQRVMSLNTLANVIHQVPHPLPSTTTAGGHATLLTT